MAKKTYASEIIEQIETLLGQTKTYASADTYDEKLTQLSSWRSLERRSPRLNRALP